ncbi:unnamed protein product [Candidula unifasciata]|uniref:Uncharacterized protein n=1 Tax=Candidula unifasciata TaxID=100452 RepID=A0A8S3YJM2_9EUPU|nr:unnamed protein product [Candidula unifasciata]
MIGLIVCHNDWSHSLSFSGKNLSLWDVRNCHVTDKPHYVVTFTIPGLSLESFDNYSNANIISLMKTAMAARTYILHHPDPVTGDVFLDWPRVTSDRYMFMSSAEYTMSRKLYDSSIPKWPLDARFSLGNVGNSSVSYVIELYVHNENTAPLWKCVTQSVSIDTATRKPSPLPDWFKDKYKGKGCMDKGFIIRGFDRPSLTYKHQLQVSWSDTDHYQHTNFTSYARFSIDALHAAIRMENGNTENSRSNKDSPATNADGHNQREKASDSSDAHPAALKGITREIISNGLKNIQICYLNESLEGQNLDAHVWQQAGQKHEVFCSIERGSVEVCQLKLEYFENDESDDLI